MTYNSMKDLTLAIISYDKREHTNVGSRYR